MEAMELPREIGEMLRRQGMTLGTVESGTGGLLSHLITSVPGSSDYYQGAVISYSNDVKMKVVGVSAATLKKHGAVSAQVAEEMARGGREVLGVDVCIADTGIAGPGGATPDKPVGLFYLGLADSRGVMSQKHRFYGDREQNKQSAAEAALRWLKEWLAGI